MNAGLLVSDLSVPLGGHAALENLHLQAPGGKITGLVGPNGAGKSTLMRACLGLIEPLRGKVEFEGQSLLLMSRRERAQCTAYVEQAATTEERLTVRDVVGLGRLPFQPYWQAQLSSGDEAVVARALDEVALSGMHRRLFGPLSGGEKQRVHMARALVQQPQLLVLDEPTSNLDVNGQLLVFEILRRRAEAGVTVFIALHDLNVAITHCDWLVVLKQGRKVAEGVPGEVLSPALLADVYGVHATPLLHPHSGQMMVSFDARIID